MDSGKKDRAAVKWILAAIGLVLILFAIWVATHREPN